MQNAPTGRSASPGRDSGLAGFFGDTSVGIHWVARDGRIQWANRAALNLLGFEPDDYIGRGLGEFIAEAPGKRDGLLARIARGESVHGDETTLRGRDGVEHRVLLSSTALWDDGQFLHMRALDPDLDRETAGRVLQASEVKFRTVFERAQDAVLVSDEAGRLLEVNPAACALFAMGKEELGGRVLADFAGSWTGLPGVIEALDGDGAARGDLRVHRADGTTRDVEYSATARILPRRHLWVLRDVTAQRALEAERVRLLAEAENARAEAERARREVEVISRAKDEFLSTLSHELRTPLNAILGWSHLLRGGDLDPESTARAVETIERNARIQSRLVGEILDLSRIVTGRMRVDARPLDLRPLLTTVVAGLAPAANAKRMHVTTGSPSFPGMVLGDAERLQQVLWNLVCNAIKFGSREGRVDVSLRPREGVLDIVVADDGPGIAAELRPLLFARFQQGDSSSTRRHGGLGVGLAFVRHIVELHGGSVAVESPGALGGATFTVTLPLLRADRRSAERHPQDAWAGSAAPGLHGLRLLVVDDDADERELLRTMLEHYGAAVTVVGDGASALRHVARDRFDALLFDVEMAGMDGYELLRRVRALAPDEGGRIPAVAVTAHGGTEDRRRTLLAGFQIHVAKPVRPEELATVVGSLLGRVPLGR